MNKKPVIGFLIINTLLIGGGFFIGQGKADSPSIGGEFKSPIYSLQNRVDTSDWKRYTNSKLGFTFLYPIAWKKNSNDINVGDRFGNLSIVKINFIGSRTNTTLILKYHVAPHGVDFYTYMLSQFHASQNWYANGRNEIEVSGVKAIEADTKVKINGKGMPINPQLRLILVDFLDKKKSGAIELEFKTPFNNEVEVAKFKQLLSSFKFSN